MTITEQFWKRVLDECDAISVEAVFEQALNECYSFTSVGGPFVHMCPGRVLHEIDPIAFRQGVLDYIDRQTCDGEWVESPRGDVFHRADVEELRDEMVEETEHEVEETEVELEELEEGDPEITELRAKIDHLNLTLSELEGIL